MTLLQRIALGLVALCVAAAATLALLAFGAWIRIAPAPGHWSVALTVAAGPFDVPLRASVPKLLAAATDPLLAPWLDGLRLRSPLGPLALRWNAAHGVLHARCAPCTLHADALGDVALPLADADFSLRRGADGRYAGTLASGEVGLRFAVVATGTRLALHGELPATRLAALAALFGDAVPEARHARIEGTVAARFEAELPLARWRVEPRFDGLAVSGLGTEALAHAQPPTRCRPVPHERVSPWLERAVIAAEDQRFAEHAGFDAVELRRALRADAPARVRGASTITQQLARLVYVGDERSVARKLRELLYALEMERTLGKGRILRLYLAMAPWGDGVCGAEGAARRWFGKGAAALEPWEAAWLAARLRAPDGSDAAVEQRRTQQVVAQLRAAVAPTPTPPAARAAARARRSPRT